MRVRLIATDVDGTLLRPDHTLSARTREAFEAAHEAGIHVLAASGRQPYSIAAIVRGSVLLGAAVGSNGSVTADLVTGEVFHEEVLAVESQLRLVEGMLREVPELRFVSVREGGNHYVAQHGYVGEQDPGASQSAWPVRHRFADLDEVVGTPSVKLVVRHPDVGPERLLALARSLGVPGVHATTSGAPFLEVSRAGVTKATALARHCAALGVAASEVVAFGDNLNDVEMIAWAGHGVAMGNGLPEAHAVADEVAPPNSDDGVAVIIERIIAG